MIPKNAKIKTNKHVAEGEVTGHYHAITEGDVLEHNEQLFIRAKKETILEHQEHKQITLPAGNKEVFIVQEYDHAEEESKNVID